MVLFKCRECGKICEGHFNRRWCPPCSEKRTIEYQKKYRADYYRKNWLKWREYRKDAKLETVGTTNLYGKMCRKANGEPDFEGEYLLIMREKKNLGLIYRK